MMAECVVRLRSCKCGDRILSFRDMEGTTVCTSASVGPLFQFWTMCMKGYDSQLLQRVFFTLSRTRL